MGQKSSCTVNTFFPWSYGVTPTPQMYLFLKRNVHQELVPAPHLSCGHGLPETDSWTKRTRTFSRLFLPLGRLFGFWKWDTNFPTSSVASSLDEWVSWWVTRECAPGGNPLRVGMRWPAWVSMGTLPLWFSFMLSRTHVDRRWYNTFWLEWCECTRVFARENLTIRWWKWVLKTGLGSESRERFSPCRRRRAEKCTSVYWEM